MRTVNKSATIYCLDQQPPYLIHTIGEATYRVDLSGKTFLATGSGLDMPMPGCPCPEQLATANAMYWFMRNRKWLPAAVFFVALAVIANVLLLATAGGEYYAAFVLSFSFWANTALAALSALCLIAYTISSFRKGLKLAWGADADQKLLDPGAITVTPDILVMSESESETAEAYALRVETARATLKRGQYLVVLPFKNPFAVVQTSSPYDDDVQGVTMLRNAPVMEEMSADITPDKLAEATNVFAGETWERYLAYCRDFSKQFVPWAAVRKLHTGAADPIKFVAALAFAVLLFAVPATAQKSRQVREYLGDLRYSQDRPDNGADVSFVFQRAALSRRADGSKTYAELLRASSVYSDAEDMGKLVGITVNSTAIAPVGKAEKPAKKAAAGVSAVAIPEDANAAPWYSALPDSSELSVMKAEHLRDKAQEWHRLKPVMDYYAWRFWSIMSFLLVLGCMFWVLSKVSATDSVRSLYGYAFIGNAITGVHIATKTVLFFILAVPTIFIIGSDAIRAYYTDTFSLFMAVKWALTAVIWYYAFEYVLPDSPQMGGGGGGGDYPGGGKMRLPG